MQILSKISTKIKMAFFNIFKKKKKERVGGMEDLMTLIRVYFQSSIASNLGISNAAALPDLLTFKRTLKVATVNNKLGVGEKKACKNLLQDLYGLDDNFFKEMDGSMKKGCRKAQEVQNYFYQFQGFSQELIMLVGTLMKWKFRIPGFLKKAMRTMTDKTVHDIFTKENWKDQGTIRSVYNVRTYASRLGYSEKWVGDYVYTFIILAKKEPKPSQAEIKEAEAKMKK